MASADPAYAEALEAISRKRPWRAAEVLAPALADSARRSPELVLLAAKAAATAGAWLRVDSILGDEPWLDSALQGRGREMLAYAALERNAGTRALGHARAALANARTAEQHGRYLVLSGRAHERLGHRDSARVGYDLSAALLPAISDWLYLRAAGLSRDERERANYYALLRTEVARSRAGWLEAVTLERLGQVRAAVRQYDSIGAHISSLRLRAATARGAVERARVRREIVSFVAANSGSEDARGAIEVLDAYWQELAASDELVVAFSAARSGQLGRARVGFSRALRVLPGSPEAHFVYGTTLSRSGRTQEATRQLALVKPPSELAGAATYERARILLRRGQRQAAIETLRAVVRRYPGDTAAASNALMLLGDIATDDLHEAAARNAYLTLARRYPTSEHASRARFNAAITAYADAKLRTAAAEMDSLADLYPTSFEAAGARYWSGRAWARLRDTARAREQWEWVVFNEPLSYYSSASAQRLGDAVEPWAPTPMADHFTRFPAIDSAVTRVRILDRLGMMLEVRLEYDGLERAARSDSSIERILSTADAFRSLGELQRSMDLGRLAVALGATDARAYRLLYPLTEEDILAAEAARRKVDPALVASVIRQESSFNPRATSPVGARGLMQMMPRVARSVARAEGLTNWDTKLLYHPEVNVRLGVAHLRSFIRHYDHPARALAAYNAGGSRVARWSRRAGAKDPELFIERIRFTETRGYVRAVLRGRDMYRALYEWGD